MTELCERCGKVIHGRIYVGLSRHQWFFFCSAECREITFNPDPRFKALVIEQLSKLYIDVDIKTYDKGGSP